METLAFSNFADQIVPCRSVSTLAKSKAENDDQDAKIAQKDALLAYVETRHLEPDVLRDSAQASLPCRRDISGSVKQTISRLLHIREDASGSQGSFPRENRQHSHVPACTSATKCCSICSQCVMSRTLRLSGSSVPPVVKLRDARLYRDYPTSHAQAAPIRPVLGPVSFTLWKAGESNNSIPKKDNTALTRPHYAVIGANATPFLRALKGDYIAVPAESRTYPYLSSDQARYRVPQQAIQYVGFNSETRGSQGVQGAYLSARYESRREETDWTLAQYLKGQIELNPVTGTESATNAHLYETVAKKLDLVKLLDTPVSNLSNGQTRRSRIAKALLGEPDFLLLDEPFMGLDPPTLVRLSGVLRDLAYSASPSILLGLRPQDPIPYWITHLVILSDENEIIVKDNLLTSLYLMSLWQYGRSSHALPAERSLSSALTERFGKRPLDQVRILTSAGVRTFPDVGHSLSNLKQKDGLWQVKEENKQSQRLRSYTQSKMRNAAKRDLQDWMNLTGILIQPSYGVLENDFDNLASTSVPVADQTLPETKVSNTTLQSEPLIQLSSIVVKYGDKIVLGYPPPQAGHNSPGLNLDIARGSRVLLLGPNGSGKTTLLSLLTSDHPQSYSLPIKFFGRTRLATRGKPGLSLWEVQSRIGHSSPEVHSFFPRHFTIRKTLESAWAETFASKPILTEENRTQVEEFLRWWEPELCQFKEQRLSEKGEEVQWASDENHPRFGALPFGTQRLLLLLRAIIKKPDIVVLDEGFSGFTELTRNKALDFLEHGCVHSRGKEAEGERGQPSRFTGLTTDQALIVVSHVREEIPYSLNEFVRLPSEEEAMNGKPVLIGRASDIRTEEGWNRIWGL